MPLKVFDPCFEMILANPPVAPPYSAEAPAVTTSMSSIASGLMFDMKVPVSGSTFDTPSTVALKSRSREP